MYFSTRMIALLFGGASLAVLGGCSPKAVPRPAANLEMSSEETGCLNRAGEILPRYLEGRATDAEIAGVWDCADRALQLFVRRTRGEKPGLYLPGELRVFLETYFLKAPADAPPHRADLKISDALMGEAMEAKRLLLGGQSNELTLAEIEKIRDWFAVLKAESLRLRPWMPLGLADLEKKDKAWIEGASRALQASAGVIGNRLGKSQSDYPFARIEALLNEAQAFQSQDGAEASALIVRLRKELPRIQALKGFWFATQESQIASTEWPRVFEAGAKAYGLVARLAAWRSHPAHRWHVAPGKDELRELARDGLVFFGDVIARHSRAQLSVDALDQVVTRLFPSGSIEISDTRPLQVSEVKEWLRQGRAIKAFWMASSPENLDAREWPVLIDSALRLFDIYARYSAWNQNPGYSWERAPGRDELKSLGREGFDLLEEVLERYPQMIIPFENLDRLLEQLFSSGKIMISANRPVPVIHAQQFLRPLIQRVMGGNVFGPQGRAASGLTRAALERLWQSIEHWHQGQRYIEALFLEAGGSAETKGLLPAELDHYSEVLQFRFSVESTETAGIYKDAVERLQGIYRTEPPLFVESDTIVTVAGSKAGARHSLAELSTMNFYHQLARLFARGWAEEAARASARDDFALKVSQEELSRFVEAIRAIGADVKYLDRGDRLLAEKRFREGSLFTFASDGDAFLSVREAAQLVALMISAKRLSNQMHEDIAGQCAQGPVDPFDYVTIEPVCYREVFFANAPLYWKRLPRLLEDFDGLKEPVLGNFKRSLEMGARKSGFSPALMNSSDSEGFASLTQYVEVVFARFDKDQSGYLDINEAHAAFPVFQRSLKEVTCKRGKCLSSTSDLRAVFTYLLGNGFAPSKWQFIRWRYNPFGHSIYANRARILKILSELSS